MMLHRHFDAENRKAKTSGKAEKDEEFVSEVFPPDENSERTKRGRKRKTDE